MKKVMKDPVHVRGTRVARRGFEILIDTGDKSKAHWVPEREVIDNQDGTFTMDRWLAFERGIEV